MSLPNVACVVAEQPLLLRLVSQVIEFFGGDNGQQRFLHDLNIDNPLVRFGFEPTVGSCGTCTRPGSPSGFLRKIGGHVVTMKSRPCVPPVLRPHRCGLSGNKGGTSKGVRGARQAYVGGQRELRLPQGIQKRPLRPRAAVPGLRAARQVEETAFELLRSCLQANALQ